MAVPLLASFIMMSLLDVSSLSVSLSFLIRFGFFMGSCLMLAMCFLMTSKTSSNALGPNSYVTRFAKTRHNGA